MKACKKDSLESELTTVCETYNDDFNKDLLKTQLNNTGSKLQGNQQCYNMGCKKTLKVTVTWPAVPHFTSQKAFGNASNECIL